MGGAQALPRGKQDELAGVREHQQPPVNARPISHLQAPPPQGSLLPAAAEETGKGERRALEDHRVSMLSKLAAAQQNKGRSSSFAGHGTNVQVL